MSFADMRNFLNMLPEDKRQGVTADFDTIETTVRVSLHFDAAEHPGKTDFHLEVQAELNLMLKMVLGSKIQGALDKIVDSLVDISEGRMPEGFDPSQFPGFNS